MQLLLDTHVALWAVTAPERLSAETRENIINPDNDVHVSVVVLWEIAIKRSTARASDEVPTLSPRSANLAFNDADFATLPLAVEHAQALEALPFHHRDPFDRIMVAQAMAEGMTLLTRDNALAAYGDFVSVV